MLNIPPLLFPILAILATALAQAQETTTPPPLYWNITTISTLNNASIFQCWQFLHPLLPPSSPSSSPTDSALRLPLSASTPNQTAPSPLYQVLPPHYSVGLHTAPTLQYVFILSGLVHLYLPNTTAPREPEEEVWIYGGKYGVILATDVEEQSELGHVTEMPGGDVTVTVQVPVQEVPEYRVLYEGGCRESELVGL